MLIGHKFVLTYQRTNTPDEWSVLCPAAERGDYYGPQMQEVLASRITKSRLGVLKFFAE